MRKIDGVQKILCALLMLLPGMAEAAEVAAASESASSQLPSLAVPDTNSEAEFNAKLKEMLLRVEKSVKIIREQITQNQSAPFLANLYMQLGDLLAQKSTVLYYIQMSRDKNADVKAPETKKFSPVVAAEQEAIAIYQQVLKDFPKFDKRDKVMYRLIVALQAIDEGAAFADAAENLIKAYPNTKEAIQAQLLLGQFYYDQQDHKKALSYLDVVKQSSYPYERNAARYRIGLIDILLEKHAEALKHFELVATDDELKDSDNPDQISLKSKSIKNNIKREALVDSVRAYTEVYRDKADPVAYYSHIAPTESLFQETIEKLAYRYIFLKKYSFAIKMLRTLCERTADPQKIMNIYHQVLMMIPVEDRIDVPAEEMRFVLDKYSEWSTHFELKPELKRTSYAFFEKQIRELGTRSHDFAKSAKETERRNHLFERARVFYLLYLGFFDRGPAAVKISTDLADVYFNQGRFVESGSMYLRTFEGEFGPPVHKEELIQNAILALQKPNDGEFYEQLRSKGLLVKAIRLYQAFDKRRANDPSLTFTLAKTIYEQGYYNRALGDLLGFMRRFPQAKEVDAAADLILYYFNIRSDFQGLVDWSQKMLALNTLNPTLKQHLQDVRSKALLKRLDEQVKGQKTYDAMAQGKSYLEAALTVGDSNLRSAAFEQALGRSKAEKDIETFLRTATAMAKSEKSPQKKAELMLSTADETLAITRFYETQNRWHDILADASLPAAKRAQAFEKSIKLNLMLRDLPHLAGQLSNQGWMKAVSAEVKHSIVEQIDGLLESSVVLPTAIYLFAIENNPKDEDWVALFKAQFKMSEGSRHSLLRTIASRCQGRLKGAVCKWSSWPAAEAKVYEFTRALASSPKAIASVQAAAQRLAGLLEFLRAYEGSGDPQLDMLLLATQAISYEAFAAFLDATAKGNAEVASLLAAKASESREGSKQARGQCQSISTHLISPTQKVCAARTQPSLAQALAWPHPQNLNPPSKDPTTSEIIEQQKSLFAVRKDWKLYFDMSEKYLQAKQWHHAAASAIYGTSAFPQNKEEFEAILGCSLLSMHLLNEARFHLTKASDINGHKQSCMTELQREVSAL